MERCATARPVQALDFPLALGAASASAAGVSFTTQTKRGYRPIRRGEAMQCLSSKTSGFVQSGFSVAIDAPEIPSLFSMIL